MFLTLYVMSCLEKNLVKTSNLMLMWLKLFTKKAISQNFAEYVNFHHFFFMLPCSSITLHYFSTHVFTLIYLGIKQSLSCCYIASQWNGFFCLCLTATNMFYVDLDAFIFRLIQVAVLYRHLCLVVLGH